MGKPVKLTRSKLSDNDKRKLVERVLRERDAGKRHYAEVDKLLAELLAGGLTTEDKIPIAGGRSVKLLDHFAVKHKHFKTVGVSRFELDVSYDD